jgi:hypothetical protein
MLRKAELEAMLLRARGTDFANARTDVVSIGTVVRCTDLSSQATETFHILGAWDSDPDRGLVSYLSPIAQALLNHKVGDEVEFELHGARHRHRVESIEAYRPAAPAEKPPAPAPAESAPAPAPATAAPESTAVMPETPLPAVTTAEQPAATLSAPAPEPAAAASAPAQSGQAY